MTGVLKECNKQNIEEKYFEIIIDKEEMPSNITVVSVCSACVLRVIKYFIEKGQRYHQNGTDSFEIFGSTCSVH